MLSNFCLMRLFDVCCVLLFLFDERCVLRADGCCVLFDVCDVLTVVC